MNLNHNLPEQQETISQVHLHAEEDLLTPDTDIDQKIEQYLDELEASLAKSSFSFEQERVRAELRDHLHALVQGYMEIGDTPGVAVQNALAQFGRSREIADEFHAQSEQHSPLTLSSLLAPVPKTVGWIWLSLLPFFAAIVIAPDMKEFLTQIGMSRSQLQLVETTTAFSLLFLLPAVVVGKGLAAKRVSYPTLRAILPFLTAWMSFAALGLFRAQEPISLSAMIPMMSLLVGVGSVLSGVTARVFRKLSRQSARKRLA